MQPLRNKIERSLLVVPGVRKAGTTTLCSILSKQEGIAAPRFKEPQYFACDRETVRSNLDWYVALFDPAAEGSLLDGSTWYFADPAVPGLLKDVFAGVKVVICLRDPALRAFSGWLHAVKQTPTQESRAFGSILRDVSAAVARGEDILSAEATLLEDAVRARQTNADWISSDFHRRRFGAPFETRISKKRFSFLYFGESCYSRLLPPWEEAFGSNVKIVFFEDLVRNPISTLEDIFLYLGLNFDAGRIDLSPKNQTRVPRGRLAATISAIQKNSRTGEYATAVLKSLGLKGLGKELRNRLLFRTPDAMGLEEKRYARRLLSDEYDYWAARAPHTREIWKDG